MSDHAQLQVAPANGDWTVKAADTVDAVVTVVRDKAVVPATTIARWIVFGLLAGVVGVALVVLFCILIVRLGAVYLPFEPLSRRVWVTQAILGGIFSLAGAFLWRKRKPRTA